MIKLSFKIAPIILAATLISGCASEFMKGTPAYTGKLVYGVAKSGEHVRWNDPKAEKIEELDMSKHLNKLNADRVNVWPLVYYNFPVTSIFWPCAEINDKGWAARPFITANDCDKNYYYMMWLGNIDNKNDSSYFIPLYYKSKDSFVSMFGGWGAESMFIVPPLFAVTDKDKDPSYHFLFPFSKYTPADNSSYVFPLYARSDDRFISMLGGWGKESMFIVPPLFAVTDRNREPAYHIMFPFGKYDTATGTHYALPLYYKSKDLFICTLGGWSDRNMVIAPPLFAITNRDEDPSYHFIFPFGNYDSKDGSSYFFPLYYSDKRSFYSIPVGWKKNEFFYAFGPLCWVNTENENIYNIMWPLVRTCPEKSEYRFEPLFDYEPVYGGYDLTYLLFLGQIWKNNDSYGSYFFPLYKYKRCPYSKLDSLLTPLFGIYDKGESFYVVPPLYSREHHKATDPKYRYSSYNIMSDLDYTDSNILFPFGKLRVMNERTENIPEYQGHAFMFYGRYKDDLSDSRWLMWPFYSYSEKYFLDDVRTAKEMKDEKSKPKIERKFKDETIMSLPFYYYKREPDCSYSNIFGFAGNIREKIAGKERNSVYAIPFYLDTWKEIFDVPYSKDSWAKYRAVECSRNLKYYFPFVATTEYPEKQEFNLMVLPFFYFYSRTPEEKSNSAFFWFFSRYEDFREKSIMSQAMWFMFYYKNQQKTATEEAFTSFRVFGKLYHREESEGKVNVDVFPFIKYSEEGKESRFSFAWRFFNVKNDGNGLKRLDIFFIPFYRKAEKK
ncbi:MAG: hypothetical protein WC082_14075 [Victivallales bacterium]